jgi:hypothetical protein
VAQQLHISEGQDTALLRAVAAQLRVPLTIISRQTELLSLQQQSTEATDVIHSQAVAALTLVDTYLLGLQLLEQSHLQLEPVSVSSVLVDVAHTLDGFAKRYNVELDLAIAGKYGPVMAHPQALYSALSALGFSFIEALGAQPQRTKRLLQLAVYKKRDKIITGAYSAVPLSVGDWQKAKQLYGSAKQPLNNLGTSGAGMFVADALGQAMHANVQVSRYARRAGLAMTLLPSKQLQLI